MKKNNLSINTINLKFRLIFFAFGLLTITAYGQSTEKTVALKVSAETPARYFGIAKGGDLNTESSKIGNLQIFVMVDTNGGELADGDDVQIKQVGNNGTFVKYLHEKGEIISRTSKPDQSAHFKVKKTVNGISLITASGKFITAKSKKDPLSFSETADKALVFEVIENPK